ncbi:MAG: hypothetical protein ACTHN5_16380 [Phycisphaerae bacterium]
MKRIVWIALLLVLSVLPATLAGGGGRAVGDGGGEWAVRGVIVGLGAMGVVLGVVGRRRGRCR